MPNAIIGTNGNQQVNVVDSKTVSLAFYSDTSQEIEVSSYQDGISFWIGKNSVSVPSFETVNIVNSSSLISSANQIRTFGVTLKSSDQALTIDLKPSNTQIAYFMLLKYGTLPVVSSSGKSYDIMKVVCPMGKSTLNSSFY